MTFYPTITVTATPGLQVSVNVPGLTYSDIIRMLGALVLRVTTLYYQATNVLQFNNPVQYVTYDRTGNLKKQVITTLIDPMQFYPSMFVRMSHRDIEFSGQNYLNFNLLVAQTINFIMYGDRFELTQLLDEAGYPNNFKRLEKAAGIPNFFYDYDDVLE